MKKINLAKPFLDKNEKDMVLKCLESTRISSNGKFIKQFENKFANLLNGGNAVTVSNGTTALQLALAVFKIGIGDEVIIPDFTYPAPMNAIIHSGAKPVLVDVHTHNWVINEDKLIDAITKKTKAIIVVHTYGQVANMDKIKKIAKKYKLFIIEDCAEALGCKYKNRMVGNLSDCSTFSFYGNKIITTGEGGMVVFKKKTHANLAKILRNQGKTDTKNFINEHIGFNFRMTNIQAAIGLSQINKLQRLFKKREEIFNFYNFYFSKMPFVTIPHYSKNYRQSFWMYTLLLNKKNRNDRNKIVKQMNNIGIEVRPGFQSLHLQPAYKKFSKTKFKNSSYLSSKTISFPTHFFLSQKILMKIINTFKKIYDRT